MKSVFPNQYLMVGVVTLLTYFCVFGLKKLLTIRLSRFIGKNGNKWDDIIVFSLDQTSHLWMAGFALYLSKNFIPRPGEWCQHIDRAFFILSMIQLGIWANSLVDRWIIMTVNRKTRSNPAAASSISFIQLLAKIFILSAVILFTLNNLGIKITTILAGLGVGGIAVALALQRILGDLFSSLSIVMDKPFVVGDFIVLDQYMGEVERIGLKTTRIRSLGGEQIIISNSDLLATRIRNFKRMHERRVAFILSLSLSTGGEEMRKAVSLITAIVSSKPRLRFERCHFMSIGKVSMDVELVYWVLSDDYNIHMDTLQDILFDVHKAFESEKLTFARPVQTVTVEPREFILRSELPMTESDNRRQTIS